MMVKIGVDGGNGFLKITLSIFDSRELQNSNFRDTGVKKSFIIGMLLSVPENYVNLKRLWLILGIDRLERCSLVTIAADLKICNIFTEVDDTWKFTPLFLV